METDKLEACSNILFGKQPGNNYLKILNAVVITSVLVTFLMLWQNTMTQQSIQGCLIWSSGFQVRVHNHHSRKLRAWRFTSDTQAQDRGKAYGVLEPQRQPQWHTSSNNLPILPKQSNQPGAKHSNIRTYENHCGVSGLCYQIKELVQINQVQNPWGTNPCQALPVLGHITMTDHCKGPW